MPILTGPHGAIRTMHGAIILPNVASTPTPTPAPVPTPTGAGVAPLLFTGPAGPPTGTLALTQTGTTSIATMLLNGAGALLLPSVQYAYGFFEGLGTFGDCQFGFTVANGPQPLNLTVLLRGAAVFFNQGNVAVFGSGLASNPGFAAPLTVNSGVSVSLIGQVLTVVVDRATIGTVTGTGFPASGYVGLGSAATPTPQPEIASIQVLLPSQIAAAQAAAAAATAAAAAQEALIGTPVTNPGADGFPSGIYFKATVHIASSCGSTPAALGSGFARGLTGAQTWTILDGSGAPINGLYFGLTSGGVCLYANGNFNFSQTGTVSASIHVTDGTTTLPPKAVTLAFSPNAVHVGCNMLLDTTGGDSGYPFGDAHRFLLNNSEQTAFAGGAVSLSEPGGLLVYDASSGFVATTDAAYPLSSHYGHITDAVLSVAAATSYTQAEEFWIAQEQPAGISVSTPAPLYDYWLTGDTVFLVTASSDAGTPSYSVVSATDPLQISSSGIVVATGPLTAGANKTVKLRATSPGGVTTDIVVTYSVLGGNVLPATNITMAVPQNLDNQVLYQVVGTPTVTGMGAGLKWRIVQKEAHGAIFSATFLEQFTCNPATGKVASAYMLPARAQGHTFTLIACDGPNVCRQTFTVPCAWWNGPTVYVGRGMNALHGNGVGYDHFSDLLPRLSNNNNWPDRTTGVATIIFAADSDPNYYANDNCNGRGAFPANDYTRFGILGSVRMIAADLNGPRVRLGGQIGAPNGGGDQGGKGFINKGVGDLYMQGFEVSWVLGDDPYHGISGIRVNADQYGDATFIDCYTHDCDNGIEAAAEVGIVTIDRCYSTNCGANYVSSGATHGYYLEGIEVIVTNTHSYKHTNGHCLKIRSGHYTVTNCILGDGARGTCSEMLNLPEGGTGTVSGCDFHKGPNAQNPSCIGFGEDDAPAEFDHPNILTVNNCRFSMMSVAGSRDGTATAVLYFPRISTTDGSKSRVLMNGNQFYMQNNAVRSMVQPTGLTDPNYIPATDNNSTTLATAPVFSFNDPRVGTSQTPGARPGFFVCTYDNETNYANMQKVQFDCGTEDLRFPASTASGTVLATITASGCIQLAIANPSDPGINPFTAGTAWAIIQTSEYFPGQVWPPVGAFTLNPSSDGTSTQLLLGPGNSAGTQLLKLEATAPNGTKCDWRYPITLTS